MSKVIGIIQTGLPADALITEHGTYSTMFQNLITDDGKKQDVDFRTFSIVDGAPMPTVEACDAWVITGSAHGVYDQLPWIPELERFSRTAIETCAPIIGICFGHQLMVQAQGGKVVKSDKGWGVGIHSYDLTVSGSSVLPGTQIASVASHQDQVTELPAGTTVLASSRFCNFGALQHGKTAFSFQFHPEFTVGYATASLARKVTKIDPAVYTKGINSLSNQRPDRAAMASFFRTTFGIS
jgi:GMP synthase-like glutamine amidotransferase